MRFHIRFISRKEAHVFHIYSFTDDVLIICKANLSQVQLVIDTLRYFCEASGLKVNFDKSRATCSSKVSRQCKENLSRISSIRFVNDLRSYLGFSLVQERVNKLPSI